MPDSTDQRVALVTGGTRGIGHEIAKCFAGAGFRVAVTGTSNESVVKAVKTLEPFAFERLHGTVLDVSSDKSVTRAVDDVLETWGRVDVLVNNAGVGGGGPFLDTDHHLWHQILEVNLSGTYRVTRECLGRGGMLQRRWGRIINIASTAGKQGVMFAAAYTASKHGVVGFTKSLGIELAKTGVTVNAVCPGFVETDLARTARANYARIWNISPETVKERFETRIPTGRYVQPEEVAPLVLYLASDFTSSITAQAINVCGGLGNY